MRVTNDGIFCAFRVLRDSRQRLHNAPTAAAQGVAAENKHRLKVLQWRERAKLTTYGTTKP
jgi:hypothetical protein